MSIQHYGFIMAGVDAQGANTRDLRGRLSCGFLESACRLADWIEPERWLSTLPRRLSGCMSIFRVSSSRQYRFSAGELDFFDAHMCATVGELDRW